MSKTRDIPVEQPITARVTKPCIYLEGSIGMYQLHMPLTVEQAEEICQALSSALMEMGR
jgi:hypothetical protein